MRDTCMTLDNTYWKNRGLLHGLHKLHTHTHVLLNTGYAHCQAATATRTTQCYCWPEAGGYEVSSCMGRWAALGHLGLNIKLSVAFSTINKK